MRNNVLGQTGSTVLSDEMAQYKANQKRTARYWFYRAKAIERPDAPKMWFCAVIGPFHSRIYGATGFGCSKKSAMIALKRTLSNNYGYHGLLMLSDKDEADTVGDPPRLSGDPIKNRTLTNYEACGKTGQ